MAVDGSVEIGTVLNGRYRLVSLLGKGGGGAVYLAEDIELFGRPVAVKELIEQFADQLERDAAVARFTQEAKILVTLNHPNLPDVRSYFTAGGRYYLVMEYVEGTTLQAQLARANGVLPPMVVLPVIPSVEPNVVAPVTVRVERRFVVPVTFKAELSVAEPFTVSAAFNAVAPAIDAVPFTYSVLVGLVVPMPSLAPVP